MDPKILIDVRMGGHSGIGRYIRAIIERRPVDSPDVLWVARGGEENVVLSRSGDALRGSCAQVYSLAEQFDRLDPVRLVWTPHYNFPLLSHAKVIVTVHDLAHLALPEIFGRGLRRAYAYLYFHALLARADHVIFVSRFGRDEFARLIGRLPRSYSWIPNGVDASWFQTIDRKRERPAKRVLAVGNVKPHKNLAKLIEALRPLGESASIELVIVGKREGFITGDSSLMADAARWITWAGSVSDGRLLELYCDADCFVMPSLYEGFGLPVLEAMAAGCLVACSTAPALVETCGGLKSGLVEYFDPTAAEAIRAAVERVLSIAPEKAKIRRDAARRHAATFNWEATASHVWEVMSRAYAAPERVI